MDNQTKTKIGLLIAKLYSKKMNKLANKLLHAQAQPTQESSSTQQLVSQKEPELKQKIEQFLSGPKVAELIEEKIMPYFQKEVDSFIQKHQDKVFIYVTNQEELIKDVTNDFPVLNYLNIAGYILDAGFILLTIKNIAQTVFTLGAGATEAVPEEMAEYAGKEVMEKFIQTSLKQTLIKIATKLISKQIVAAGVKTIGKAFAYQAGRQIALMSLFNAISSTLTQTSLASLKNILMQKGVSEFGLPQEFVAKFVKPETTADTAKNIAKSFMQKTEDGLKQMFATQAGLEHLAFSTALSLVWGASGRYGLLSSEGISKLEQLKNQITKMQQSKTDQSSDEALSDDQINEMLGKSHIPKNLYSNYVSYLKESTKTEQDALIKIHAADLLVDSINNNVLALATLDFITQYKTNLAKQPTQIEKLLQHVVGSDSVSLKTLMSETETENLDSLIATLRKDKTHEIQGQMQKLAVDNLDQKTASSLMNYFMAQANVDSYKKKLAEEVFGERRQVS